MRSMLYCVDAVVSVSRCTTTNLVLYFHVLACFFLSHEIGFVIHLYSCVGFVADACFMSYIILQTMAKRMKGGVDEYDNDDDDNND